MKALAVLMVAASLVSLGSPGDDVERCWAEMRRAEAPPACVIDAATALAARVVPELALDSPERRKLGRALAAAVSRELDRSAVVEPRGLARGEERYEVATSAGAKELVLVRSETGWSDVLWDGTSMVDRYRALSERLVGRYSFEHLLGELSGAGVVVLADFEEDTVGAPPSGWKRRTWGDDHGRTPYVVAEEAGNRFLRAEARGENVMLYKEVRWDARRYPYLAWRWRIRSVPEGSDERLEERADSAAGLYLSYRRKLGLVPETVKFVWSGRYEPGTFFRRPGIGMPWTFVASSGAADAVWHRVVFRTADVYARTFGGDPGERPLGIALLTDANDTGSFAAADYDDVVALTSPDGL